MDWKTVGLVANSGKSGAADFLKVARAEMTKVNVRCLMDAKTAALLGETSEYSVDALARHCDLLISLGGDGTLLQLFHDAGFPLPPILGVNAGTLGFLTGVAQSEFLDTWSQVISDRAVLSERTILSIDVIRDGESFRSDYALNEVVLSRGERSRLIRLRVEIDGVALTEYNADGLIVATPTGSSAYSLSAGGPLIAPEAEVFVITPICPHVLTNRSVIVNDRSSILLQSASSQHGVCLTSDGRDPLFLDPGDVVRIRRAPGVLRLVFPEDLSFFEVLRRKFKWSGSAV